MSKMTYDEVYDAVCDFYGGDDWNWKDLNRDWIKFYIKLGEENMDELKAIYQVEVNAAPVLTYDEVYEKVSKFLSSIRKKGDEDGWGYYQVCYWWDSLLMMIAPKNEDKLREVRANLRKRDGIVLPPRPKDGPQWSLNGYE